MCSEPACDTYCCFYEFIKKIKAWRLAPVYPTVWTLHEKIEHYVKKWNYLLHFTLFSSFTSFRYVFLSLYVEFCMHFVKLVADYSCFTCVMTLKFYICYVRFFCMMFDCFQYCLIKLSYLIVIYVYERVFHVNVAGCPKRSVLRKIVITSKTQMTGRWNKDQLTDNTSTKSLHPT